MGVESIVVPHVSLFMGYVNNFEMLEQIFSAVHGYAQTLSPFMLDATCMYFKGISLKAPQYLFIDFLQNEFLMFQKEEISKLLDAIVYPLEWNMKAERTHITVGCYKNLTPSVREMINSYNAIPSCKISQLGVSIAGKCGVCLSLLKVFDLK